MKKMKKWQSVFALSMLVSVLFSLAACGKPKEAIPAADFKYFMEDKGLTINDETENMEGEEYQYAYVAVDMDKYSFEYYFMRSPSSAKSLYNYLVENVRKAYDGKIGTVTGETAIQGNADFSLSASDYYIRAIKVQNAVLYVTAYPEFKDEAKDMIKELGY